MVWSTLGGHLYRQLPRNYWFESTTTVPNTTGALSRSPRTFSELPGIESNACLTISKIFCHCESSLVLPSSHMRIPTIPNVQSSLGVLHPPGTLYAENYLRLSTHFYPEQLVFQTTCIYVSALVKGKASPRDTGGH